MTNRIAVRAPGRRDCVRNASRNPPRWRLRTRGIHCATSEQTFRWAGQGVSQSQLARTLDAVPLTRASLCRG